MDSIDFNDLEPLVLSAFDPKVSPEDRVALQQLIVRTCQPIIYGVLTRHYRWVDQHLYQDLVQEGTLALYKSMRAWSRAKTHVDWTVFAWMRIKNQCSKFLRKHNRQPKPLDAAYFSTIQTKWISPPPIPMYCVYCDKKLLTKSGYVCASRYSSCAACYRRIERNGFCQGCGHPAYKKKACPTCKKLYSV